MRSDGCSLALVSLRGKLALAAVLWAVSAPPAVAQFDFNDEPILASRISDEKIEMRGRWVRQWRDASDALVLMFNGGFRLNMGQRQMSANNAVVWVEPRQDEETGRKYYALTVYLSENAEVLEPAGTVTLDTVLLVRGLRTFGEIIKYHDAYAPESMEDSPLYLAALRDRLLVEQSEATAATVGPEVARPTAQPPAPARPKPVIRYQLAAIEPAQTPSGEPVLVARGGVYFSQDGGPDAPMLEIRAQSAVVFPAEGAAGTFFGSEGETGRQTDDGGAAEPPRAPPQQAERSTPEEEPAVPAAAVDAVFGMGRAGAAEGVQSRIRAVYLEGDVVLSLGNRFVRSNRLYYDFEHSRALILDAVLRAEIPERDIPLYVRAAEVRQLSGREFVAENAVVTTSEFFTPSYHVGAERVYVRDLTARDDQGRATSPSRGAYEMKNSTLNIGGVPVAWWPYSKGTLESSETLLRRIATGYSKQNGFEFESGWYLFNLLGIQAPPGYDATLLVDYYSERGPAVGIDLNYEREDYYGFLRSYFIYDNGEDNLGPDREDEEEPGSPTRGRLLWRHRHYLPYDWELTLEASYISDANFLEEFRKQEYQEGKEQETLVYLKRAKDVEAITFLANWRLLDFLTQTEHLPEAAYRRIGDTFLSPAVLYHESRIGMVRYRRDGRESGYERWADDLPQPSDLTFRTDARQEAEVPLKLGAVNVVPFASVRGSYWDGQPKDDGGLWRGLGVYGVRGASTFSRVYDDVKSALFDVNRIRHIIKPDFTFWWANSNTRSDRLTPYDYGVETIDAVYGATFGLRQTWQTKRGPPGRERTSDLLTFNLEAGVFGDTEGREDISNGYANPLRPENSRTRNYIAGDAAYRLSDSTSLLYDFNFDMNDRSFDSHNFAVAVERDPRLAYMFGVRYAGDISMNYVGGGWNYKLNEKYSTATRVWLDADTGQVGEIAISYIRRFPRWYAAFVFGYDEVNDDFSISISLWPEGVPEWTLGSRRFTPVGTTTGIRP